MAGQSSIERYIAKFPRSRALHEKARGIFRNGVTHETRFVQPFPIYITHAKGSHKWDVDGYEYIDYFGGHGALLLGHAHPSLTEAVNNQIVKGTQWGACHELEIEWADLAYNGLLYEPLIKDIQAFNDENQKQVSGKVKMKVDNKNAFPSQIKTKNSLIDEKIGSYAQSGTWKGKDAESFIKFYGLQQKIAANKLKK